MVMVQVFFHENESGTDSKLMVIANASIVKNLSAGTTLVMKCLWMIKVVVKPHYKEYIKHFLVDTKL
jgi:hypothetical protein